MRLIDRFAGGVGQLLLVTTVVNERAMHARASSVAGRACAIGRHGVCVVCYAERASSSSKYFGLDLIVFIIRREN